MRAIPIYQFHTNKPRPWEEIENHYRIVWDGQLYKMLELVQHIRSSGLAARLYACTSMHALIVTTNNPMDFHKDALHVNYDLNTNHFRFEYFSMPFQDAEFNRIYPSHLGIEKFDNFIKMIRW